jgi:hypothetical protein
VGRSHPEQRVNRVEAEMAHSGSARGRTAVRPYRHICVRDSAVHIAGYGRLGSLVR